LDNLSSYTSEGAVNDLACQDNAPDRFMSIGVVTCNDPVERRVTLLCKECVKCSATINVGVKS